MNKNLTIKDEYCFFLKGELSQYMSEVNRLIEIYTKLEMERIKITGKNLEKNVCSGKG